MMTFAPLSRRKPTSASVGRRASKPVSPLQSVESARERPSGLTCSARGMTPEQNGLSWSSHREMRRGKPKSLVIFAELADTSPSLSSALATLVRRISAGDATWLPAPVCRDWRSPGKRSHKRLSAPRGQPLPETIGTRLPSSLLEWMIGVPKMFTIGVRGSKR